MPRHESAAMPAAVTFGALLLGGLSYLLLVERSGRGLPCLFHELTGWHCPGCGLTRMFIALAHLDFARAFHCNAAAMLLIPALPAYFICKKLFGRGDSSKRAGDVFYYLCLALLIAFGVARNLPSGQFLAPPPSVG